MLAFFVEDQAPHVFVYIVCLYIISAREDGGANQKIRASMIDL